MTCSKRKKKLKRRKRKRCDSPSPVAVQNQPLLVHSLSNPDDLVLREDGSVQRVLQRDDTSGSRVNVVAKNKVGLDVAFQREMVTVGGRDSY